MGRLAFFRRPMAVDESKRVDARWVREEHEASEWLSLFYGAFEAAAAQIAGITNKGQKRKEVCALERFADAEHRPGGRRRPYHLLIDTRAELSEEHRRVPLVRQLSSQIPVYKALTAQVLPHPLLVLVRADALRRPVRSSALLGIAYGPIFSSQKL
jgi:hypothetical protein